MNAIEIKRMLMEIMDDSVRNGRPCKVEDGIIMDNIVRMYYTCTEIDYEEAKWLFINYLKNGVLDFAKAKELGYQRMYA